MCIIYKPAGISYDTLLNKHVISACRRNSPNGFGAITMHSNGFMSATQFLGRDPFNFLNDNMELDNTNYEIALHFRYATSGAINRDNLQPFGFYQSGDGWFEHGYWMHNGVLPLQPANRDESDSSVYYKRVILPVISQYHGSSTQELNELRDCLECLTPRDSRFLFMCPKIAKRAILTGNGWVQDDNGLWLSHGGYL